MLPDLKPFCTYEQQMEILRKRGCIIENEQACCEILADLNYYRLTAYFLPFRQSDDNFKPGTNFETIFSLYEFDRKMRGVIFSAIEEVEVFFHALFIKFIPAMING